MTPEMAFECLLVSHDPAVCRTIDKSLRNFSIISEFCFSSSKASQRLTKGSHDLIVIDTPPTLGILTVNALVTATHLLVPIQSSYFALEGTDDLLETVERVKARPNPDLKVLGVLITLHDKRTILAKDIYKQIKNVFGPKVFKTVISKNVRLEESPAYKEAIFSFAPHSTGAIEYFKLSDEVLDRV